MNILGELTIVIPQLPCIFSMAKAISSTIQLVNSVSSNSVNLFDFATCAFATECFTIQLVPCSDGWRRTWWLMRHMMPVMQVSSILQCKSNCQEGACLELFQAIGCFEPTFMEAYQALIMICNVRLLKSRIKTTWLFEHIPTSSKVVLRDFESVMVVELWKLCNSSWETVKWCLIAK